MGTNYLYILLYLSGEYMTVSLSASSPPKDSSQGLSSLSNHNSINTKISLWLLRYILAMAIATLFLMALGSATRVMNAGLSCPDWPLCYGEFVPIQEMNLLVFLEWSHRLVATAMGLFTLILVGTSWWYRPQLPVWLPWATILALLEVLTQGILGGLTVTQLLRFDIVTAHLSTGLLYFSTLLAIAICLRPYTQPFQTATFPTRPWIKWLGFSAVISVYFQSILGALVSSQWALHQCLAGSELCQVLHNHFLGVVPSSLLTLIVFYLALSDRGFSKLMKGAGLSAGLLLFAQIGLGFTTYKLQLQIPEITVLHQTVGAGLLGALIIFTTATCQNSAQNTATQVVAEQIDQIGNLNRRF
jgi:heme a synthase